MDLRHAAALLLLYHFLLPSLAAPSPAPVFNITAILAVRQNFTTFNSLLTKTNLSTEINKRRTITVCAVSDPGMQDLLAKNLSLIATKNLLSLHVLADYFDSNSLQEISGGSVLASTMFQASGYAVGSSGIIKISDLKGGRVEFLTQDGYGKNASSAYLVTQVYKKPYDLSIIQLSNVFNTTVPGAAAPAAPAAPQTNLTAKMSGRCKVFAETLANSPAQETFDLNSGSGLTVFCPSDDAMTNFLPRFRKLTAEGKASLLEYHGIPIYQTMNQLRLDNKKMRTLASGAGKPNYEIKLQDNGTEITIETKVTAKIVMTVLDSQPVAIYKLNKVLLPEELFNSSLPPATAPSPAPAQEMGSAPAPGPGAASPRASMPISPPAPPAPPEEWPADSPAFGPVADLIGKTKNEAARFNGGGVGAVTLSLVFVISLL